MDDANMQRACEDEGFSGTDIGDEIGFSNLQDDNPLTDFFYEDIGRYSPGGYHPTHLGDEFGSGRYRILYLLGHGAHSTVWLAENRHYGTFCSAQVGTMPAPPVRYVAIKMLTADATAEIRVRENVMLTRLQYRAHHDSNIGQEYVFKLFDKFDIHGPNGIHLCMATEFLGPDFYRLTDSPVLKSSDHSILQKLALRSTSNLANGLAFIHSCGITHRDLNAKNLAFTVPASVSSLTVDELYDLLGGRPEISHVSERTCYQPQYQVAPPPLSKYWALCISNGRIPDLRIFGFTESSVEYPAVIGGVDIWAFACTAYCLLDLCKAFHAPWFLHFVMFSHGKGMKGVEWTEFCKQFSGVELKFTADGEPSNYELLEEFYNWDRRVKGKLDSEITDPEGFSDENLVAIMRIFGAVLVGGVGEAVDPVHKVTAQDIVRMTPKGWADEQFALI